jgi:hypothetical protein
MRYVTALQGALLLALSLPTVALSQVKLSNSELNALTRGCKALSETAENQLCTSAMVKLMKPKAVETRQEVLTKTANPIEFMGIQIGNPEHADDVIAFCKHERRRNYPEVCDRLAPGFEQLGVIADYGPVKRAIVTYSIANDGALEMVRIPVNNYDLIELVKMYTERYGKPDLRTETLRTTMGVSYDAVTHKWTDEKGNVLTVATRSTNYDYGHVLFVAPSALLRAERDEEDRKSLARGKM